MPYQGQTYARGTCRMMESVHLVDSLLRNQEFPSLDRLAVECEASPRTVQRYLRFIRSRLGKQVTYCRENRGYYYPDGGLKVAAADLSEGELLALYVAAPILAQYRGTSLEQRFRGSFEKICRRLPSKVRARLPSLDQRVAVKAKLPAEGEIARFDELLDAIRRDRRLELRYWSAYRAEETRRRVDPYVLYQVGWRWYLVGHCHLRGNLRLFELGRIRELRLLDELFERPQGLELEELMAGSLGVILQAEGSSEDIVLHFGAFAARYVRETRLHASQQLAELPDGGVELRLHVAITAELERLVLGWGEHVVVVRPDTLRKRIARRLLDALGHYLGDGARG